MARHQHAAGHTSPLHVFCIPCSCRQFTIIQPFFSSCRRVGRSDLFCNQRICHHPAVDRRGAGTGVRFAEGLLHTASLSHFARLLLLSIGRVNFQLGGLDTGERDREDRIRFFLYDTKIVSNGWFAGHSWSLAVEEQFYIVFPIFWVLSPPKRRATVLFLTLAAFLTWTAFSQWGYGANLISRSSIIGFSCINVGALLAIFEPRAIRFSAGLPSLAIFLVSALLFIHPVSTSTLASGLYSVCVPFGIALMLMYSIGHTGWISSALKHPVILWCGLISYSAYLWQEVFTGAADSYGSPGAAKVFHFMVPLIPLVAGVSFYCIERPCTRLGRRLSARISGRNASNAPLRVAAS